MSAQGWYNYDTGGYDLLHESPLTSVEAALPYLPDGPARSMFRIYVEDLHEAISEAYLKVMEKVAASYKDESV